MAQFKSLFSETYNAAAAMASRHRFCKFTAEYTINYAGANEGQLVMGVNFDTAAAAGRGVLVTTIGNPKVEAGGAFAAGALLKPAAGGKAVAAVSGDSYCARAIQAATADLDVVEIRFEHGEMD